MVSLSEIISLLILINSVVITCYTIFSDKKDKKVTATTYIKSKKNTA